MRKYRPPVIDSIRPFLGAIVGVAVLAALFGFNLNAIPPGVAPFEADIVQTVQNRSLGAREILLEDPLYLPYKIGIYCLEKLGLTSLAAIRGVGAAFALLATLSMYLILKRWHTRRIAIFGTLLFATSSWLLHSARLAVPETTYLLLPLLIFLGSKLEEGKHPLLSVTAALGLSTSLLYAPGLVWFIVPAALWQRRRIAERFRDVNTLTVTLISVGTLVLLGPLIYALVTQNVSFWAWLGVGQNIGSLKEVLISAARVPLQIAVTNHTGALFTLGRLPLIDIATTVLVLLGAYWYFFQRKLDRTKLITGALALGTVLVALNGPLQMGILLPFVYLTAAAGLTLMLQQWFTVFPRNPLARGIGIGLITALVILIGLYHLQRYFVAWPNAPETKASFIRP